jgi:uncharacterized protein
MPEPARTAYAFNRTRQLFLARQVTVADTHWLRLRGLIGTPEREFQKGTGLWIVPCRGVHTLAMGFSIDAIYLNQEKRVVHVERTLKPWRFAALRIEAATVLEVPAGMAAETGTEVGDQTEIEIGEPVRL